MVRWTWKGSNWEDWALIWDCELPPARVATDYCSASPGIVSAHEAVVMLVPPL